MKLLYGESDRVARFVAIHIPDVSPYGFGGHKCQAIGVTTDAGELVGGMVFHEWWPEHGTIEFSGAATTPRWLTRRILDELFGYAFDEVGAQLLITRNSARNHRLHRQLKAYGFDRIDIPRLFGRDEDGVVWTLTAEAYRAGRFHVEARRPQAA